MKESSLPAAKATPPADPAPELTLVPALPTKLQAAIDAALAEEAAHPSPESEDEDEDVLDATLVSDKRGDAPWLRAWREMQQIGIKFGTSFTFEQFSEWTGVPDTDQLFGRYIREINNKIQYGGYYLRKDSINRKIISVTAHDSAARTLAYNRTCFRAAEHENIMLQGLLGNPEAMFSLEERTLLSDQQNKAAFKLQLLMKQDRMQRIADRYPRLID